MKTLYVWPDGSWRWPEEYCEVSDAWKGSDFRQIAVTDDCDDDDAERIADMEAMADQERMLEIMGAFIQS